MKRRGKNREHFKKDLYEAISLLKTPAECEDFLIDLCSPAELQALADRWHVAKLLTEEFPYRAISEKTGISLTTVTRTARVLFDGNNGLKLVMKRQRRKKT